MRHAALPVALLILASACGDDLCGQTASGACVTFGADGSTAWPEERRFHLPSGVLVEAGLDMRADDSVDVSFASGGGPVVWDIHIHDGDQIRTEAQGQGGEGMFTFVAPQDGTYWSLWLNDQVSTLEVDVVYQGHGSTAFRGWL